MLSGWRGILALLASSTAAALLVAGCGSSGSQPGQQAQVRSTPGVTATGGAVAGAGTANGAAAGTPHPRPAAPASSPALTSPANAATCQTAALAVTLDGSQAGGAAGSMYLPLDFTNESGQSCALDGFPGVSFVAATSGVQLGAVATRDPGFPIVRETVQPGQSVHAWLRVAAAQNYPDADCHPVTANWLRVYPPGNTMPTYVRHTFAACRSSTSVILTVTPVRGGRGSRGAVP